MQQRVQWQLSLRPFCEISPSLSAAAATFASREAEGDIYAEIYGKTYARFVTVVDSAHYWELVRARANWHSERSTLGTRILDNFFLTEVQILYCLNKKLFVVSIWFRMRYCTVMNLWSIAHQKHLPAESSERKQKYQECLSKSWRYVAGPEYKQDGMNRQTTSRPHGHRVQKYGILAHASRYREIHIF